MFGLASLLLGPSLWGAPADYRFETTQPQFRMGGSVPIVVSLTHVPSGKLVSDAIIFQTRLEMTVRGMDPMRAKATMPKPAGPGLYTLQAPLTMAGAWTLHLSAKVQGEKDTVVGTVTFTVIE